MLSTKLDHTTGTAVEQCQAFRKIAFLYLWSKMCYHVRIKIEQKVLVTVTTPMTIGFASMWLDSQVIVEATITSILVSIPKSLPLSRCDLSDICKWKGLLIGSLFTQRVCKAKAWALKRFDHHGSFLNLICSVSVWIFGQVRWESAGLSIIAVAGLLTIDTQTAEGSIKNF